jgi:hypothetical protein
LRKRSIIISSLCILLALPSGALAEGNTAQTPQTIKVERGKQQNALKAVKSVKSENITALADDTLGPVLVSATAGPTTVGVNETITITAIASDDLSGVAEVVAYLNLPSGGYKVVPLTLENPETGEWKGTYIPSRNSIKKVPGSLTSIYMMQQVMTLMANPLSLFK